MLLVQTWNGANNQSCQLNVSDMQGGQLAATLEGFKSLFSKAERMQIPRLAASCAMLICTNYW
jgi:hypothetical protein